MTLILLSLGNIDNKKDILLTIENNVRALGIDL
jgi:hypothetical protein